LYLLNVAHPQDMDKRWVVARHEFLNEARDGAFKLIDGLCLAEQALQVLVRCGL